ncbi:4'-phosphopantetheinyl transferase superfamily protein [Ureaplasma miroungigenitalium]|uniref:4'-phosphopantetheinyl transferase superfamily protein n=1 Tax=Ureaplasma miroungigenitalium TaxID=1042321 RepID=A0ABT3BLS7_9BACT|nr:4'-phosphopantetheinyl transferase superfamily protein [Ureaplasma miroungigenitalium]MCV3728209.1 4'-phosphopantetheinyl transferase superfamily protein [Ureaplasma miroungigenitalium]MCV3734013.1 4'-phosphopantetheinyl transferase superfamily protein [Ureaplasma miroungigenitalium]
MQIVHGIDLLDLKRPVLKNKRLARRIMTDYEYAIYEKHTQPERYLGSLFSCKEAVMKAFYLRYLYDDIEIHIVNGIHFVYLQQQKTDLALTLSYESDLVMSSVVGII